MLPKGRGLFRVVLLITALLLTSCTYWQTGELDSQDDTASFVEIERTAIPRDGIPPLDYPEYISVEDADAWIDDDELVLAFDYKGDKRVYPLQLMLWHEIVNEQLKGDPLVITYCPLCGSGIAYSRLLDGTELTFGNTGQLYRRNLVMYDRNTESYWSQIEGKAIMGELTGKKLTPISIDTVVWGQWKVAHPDSLVLSKDTGYRRPYGLRGQFSEGDFLFYETSEDIQTHSVVYGVEVDGNYKAYRDKDLKELGEIIDRIGEVEVKISRDDIGKVTVSRTATGEEIIKERDYWFAWLAFHPETELYTR